MNAKVGLVVRAIAGRDKDNFFVILRVEGDFVYIADGKSRKIEIPKKKRLKHLRFTNTVIDMDMITNKSLRKMLNEYSQKCASEEGGSNFV